MSESVKVSLPIIMPFIGIISSPFPSPGPPDAFSVSRLPDAVRSDSDLDRVAHLLSCIPTLAHIHSISTY